MALPDHPMKKLKGTPEARALMEQVRSHRGGATKPMRERGKSDSYREIAERHLPKSKGD